MKRYLVVYVPHPIEEHFPFCDHVRGRWVEGCHYDDARRKLRELGFFIYTSPIGLTDSQVDNPEDAA